MSALAGIRVVDGSDGTAGPLAGMLFADLGADVLRVGPPAGTPASVVWNRGKQTVDGPVEALLSSADVWIVGGRGTSPDLAAAAADHPRLVVLHTPPYTHDAPWAGGAESDALLAAASGVALRQFSVEGGPVESIYPHLVVVQGVWAAAAATAALVERERSGVGQVVTVSGLHGMMIAAAGALTFDPAAPPVARSPGGPGGSVPFYRVYRCLDGEWLFLAALTPHFSQRAFEVLGITDLLGDERLGRTGRAGMLRPENTGWVIDRIAAVFTSRPRDEWLKLLADGGCPAGPLLRREDWLDHPQLAAIGMRMEVDDPVRGAVVMPGVTLHLAGAAPSPAPSAPRSMGNGPLDGFRVLDLGAIIAGPFAASLLADLGADVIKVEPPAGDSFRGPGFAAYNKGQRGVVVDLRESEGREAFLSLVRTADVVVDNYRPGVLERLRITREALAAVNPGVITVSITGFGEGGPLSDLAGFDPVLQAMSGMMRAQGGADDPVFFTVPVNDVTAAATAAFGACAALLQRARGGGAQRVWTSLAAMSALLQAGDLVRWEGRPPAAVGGRDHPGPTELDRYHRVADGWVRAHAGPGDEDALAAIGPMTREAAVAHLTTRGVPAVVTRSVPELTGDADLVAFGILEPDPRPGREGWWTTGRHALFSRTQRTGSLVAPALGEHTQAVLDTLQT